VKSAKSVAKKPIEQTD